ncbi:class I SAM-dependent methyltransferase [Sphingomonas jatrophae]|uniref:class I SAM-dependent methyltransferase n=1 Tax=Sphingomonas jatrophae TaxID=1166337 RepID=UPI000B8771A0|nr:methyltransferase domain-containing protein [Sphingomonas jatrophae]
MAVPQIFDRARRRLRRDRAARRFPAHRFLIDHIEDELIDRLDAVRRDFTRALVIGAHDGRLPDLLRAKGMAVDALDAGPAFAASNGTTPVEEDALGGGVASYDLVLSAGVLDQVADLPGALIQIRRALAPDGLFLGGFVGAGSLPRLRTAMAAADALAGAAAARIHPQIDVRTAGDLLGRAGFALQVADGLPLDVRYPSLTGLIADLRGMGATNLLAGPVHPLPRDGYAAAAASFAAAADADGRTTERFELVFLTGWSPAESQPKPARRGSATTSLTDVLKAKV